MTPKTYKKTTQTVDDIIHCATEYFKSYGYKKTTVVDIASNLHISKKTLYSLFPSKEAILKEAAWRDTTETMRKFSETVRSDLRLDVLLLSLCRFIFTDRIKNGKNGLFWGIHSDDKDIHNSFINSLKRVINEIYEEGCRNGIFKPVDSFFATEAVVNIVMAALSNFHRVKDPVRIFNDALTIIADSVAYKSRIPFDSMG